MSRTVWGDEIPDEYDARREGGSASRWARNPYDNFGVNRAEEEAHDAWEAGRRVAEQSRQDDERREEERRLAERRHEEERLEYERLEYERAMYEQAQQEEQP